MVDSFHIYLKKQLLDYVESERKKGLPLEQIEHALLNAGHEKNLVDDVFTEMRKGNTEVKLEEKTQAVEKDLSGMLKGAFSQFMAKASEKEIGQAKKVIKNDSEEIVKEVIEEAEVIEEKRMFESVAFFLYLVALGLVILVTAGGSGSEIVNVAIGFLPTIINMFVSFMALGIANNVPLYVFIPLGITSMFYAIGKFSGLPLFQGMEMEALSVVNFLFSFVFNIMVVYVRFLKPRSMKRRVIKKNNIQKKQPVVVEQMHYTSVEKTEKPLIKVEREEIHELKKEFGLR